MQIIETRHGRITTETDEFFGTYYKQIEREKHYFEKYQGYGFSDYELEEMKLYLVNRVILRVKMKDGTNQILVTTYEMINRLGHHYVDKRTLDHQLILAEHYFIVKGTEE